MCKLLPVLIYLLQICPKCNIVIKHELLEINVTLRGKDGNVRNEQYHYGMMFIFYFKPLTQSSNTLLK